MRCFGEISSTRRSAPSGITNAPYLLIDESITMYGSVIRKVGNTIGLRFGLTNKLRARFTRRARPTSG
jgi:hypothetical protein